MHLYAKYEEDPKYAQGGGESEFLTLLLSIQFLNRIRHEMDYQIWFID